jgi:hypothetical protein
MVWQIHIAVMIVPISDRGKDSVRFLLSAPAEP